MQLMQNALFLLVFVLWTIQQVKGRERRKTLIVNVNFTPVLMNNVANNGKQIVIFITNVDVTPCGKVNTLWDFNSMIFSSTFLAGSLKLVFVLLTVLGILIPIASIIYCFWTTRRSASSLEQVQRRLADNDNNLLNQSLPDFEALVSHYTVTGWM